jgi:broad specificity phosphatase PhoE
LENLILVKHSLPVIVPDVPANRWELSEEGRSRAARLGASLRSYYPDAIVSSPEPKAQQTAAIVADILGLTFETVDGLQEHERSDVPFIGDSFQDAVADFFARPSFRVLGRETADQAHDRFAGALARILDPRARETLAVVSHGTVISLYVSRITALDPMPLWKALGLPSYVVLSLPAMNLQEIVGSL